MGSERVSVRRWLGAASIVLAGTALAACSGEDDESLTVVAEGSDDALATDPVPPTDPSPTVTSPPVPPPAEVVLEVGPRQEVCAHEHAVAAPFVGAPCHPVTISWQGVDSDQIQYSIVPGSWDEMDRTTLPMGPANSPREGTAYDASFAARPDVEACIGISALSPGSGQSGQVTACVMVMDGSVALGGEPGPPPVSPATPASEPAVDDEFVPAHPGEEPPPPAVPVDFTLTAGPLQSPCTHPYGNVTWTSCHVITATWQAGGSEHASFGLFPTALLDDPRADTSGASLPLGPSQYPRDGDTFTTDFAAAPGQRLCVTLNGSYRDLHELAPAELPTACIGLPPTPA